MWLDNVQTDNWYLISVITKSISVWAAKDIYDRNNYIILITNTDLNSRKFYNLVKEDVEDIVNMCRFLYCD